MTQHKNFPHGQNPNAPEKNERTVHQPTATHHPQGQQQGQQRNPSGGQQGGFNAAHDGRLPQANYGTQPGFDISDFEGGSEPGQQKGKKK
jgi:hypothetical protein